MASTIDKIKRDFVEALNASQRKTSAYDTEAEVVRIEGNTAWVHIGGGVTETPVQLTINAKKGDKVQVRVSNEGAWIMGNATAPPTDDAVAKEVKQDISETNIIVEEVKTVAEQTKKIAGNTNQYFWHTQEGTDTGAHITEIPQEDFIADPQNGGGNLLARSNGIAVRDGLTELASFSVNGIQLGLDTESHLSMDYHSIQAIDKEGETYFYVSDLRDAEGYAELTQIVKTYNEGGYSKVRVMYPFVSPEGYSPTVTIEGVEQDYTYTSVRNVLQLANSVPTDTEATVVYKTTTTDAKAYTLGFRNPDYPIGTLSVAENKNTIANGGYSHAEGNDTIASGRASHAEGMYTIASEQGSHAEGYHTEAKGASSHAQGLGTIAAFEGQTALGVYNIEDTPQTGHTKGHYAVMVGNGSSSEARSNALTIDWSGNVNIPSGATYQIDGEPVGERRTLLWTNPNPSTSFAGQDVAISSLSNFESIEIEFVSNAPNIKFRNAQGFTAPALIPAWASPPSYRNAVVNSTGIHFSDAFEKSQTTNNSMLIPYKIYGIKE